MEKQVAGAEVTINVPIDTVWHAITNSKIALMPDTVVESGWNVGDPITFEGEFDGRHFKDYGEITARDDGKSVAFSHWSKTPERPDSYHVVRYVLDDKVDATHVTLTQTNVGPHPDIDARTKAEFDKNWQVMLQHLKKSVEAG